MPGATAGVIDNQTIEVNGLTVSSYHTPCHTRGHICYYIRPSEGEEEEQKHTVEKINGY